MLGQYFTVIWNWLLEVLKTAPHYLLFSTISNTYSIIGLVRNSRKIKQNEYKNVLDRDIFYVMKTIKYKNRDAYEGLIRIDRDRFLSILDYGESDRDGGEQLRRGFRVHE